MILYALYFGVAAVGASCILAIWRLVSGSGVADGEWALDMISINAVVMLVLLCVATTL